MKENLHRFFRAARGAGVRVSPAESIDAMRAVAKVGLSDRAVLRDTFLLTLAKSEEQKKALGDCFDLFFAQPELTPPSIANDRSGAEAQQRQPGIESSGEGQPSENLGPLAQMLLAQDLVAQVFRFLASIEQKRLRDRFAHVLAQGFGRGLQPLGQRGVGCDQIVEIVPKAGNAHRIEHAGREQAALGKKSDVGK